ncbi:MAG: hypothetical protein LAQ69_27855 [Acidobacteriia bacterium]|nr:hypothetical protein [Terriglobia bacterium]
MTLGRVLALFVWALPIFAQYAGPAILSRGEAPAAMSSPEIKFRPFVEFNAIYDTGLSGVAVTDAQGTLPNLSSYGLNLSWGVSGMHRWRHTQLGLDYHGGLSHFVQQSSYDSVDQSILLGITHQITRHATVSLRESAGMFTRVFGLGGLAQSVPFDPSQSYIPTTDFFDNRTYYLSTQADLRIQKTARLSFDFGGDHFLTSYRAAGLVGTTGLVARGDVQYRVGRRTTIGAIYQFQHFRYQGAYGATDAHSVAATFARSLSAKLEVSAALGVSRVEPKFIQSVAVDPIIAILLGVSSTTEIAHFVTWIPTGSARLARTFRQGVLYVSGERAVVPGNGLFTTSYSNSVSGGYTYTGIRRWSLNSYAAYTRSKSVGNFTGDYRSVSAGFSASRQIARYLHFVFGYNARTYSSQDFHNYNRTISEGRVGLGFTPGEVPLRIW